MALLRFANNQISTPAQLQRLFLLVAFLDELSRYFHAIHYHLDRASGLGTGATPNGENATTSQKVPCRVATTANIALAGLQTLDTVTVVADDRVLVRDETDA